MRYQFIEQHRAEYEVSLMCELLQVSRSGYYAWRKRPVSAREMANQQLLEQIERAYEASGGRYGSPRVYADIKDEIPCSLNRVARLMQQHGIRGKQTKRYKKTTQQNEKHAYAPNLLDQNFTASRPGEKWCSDITYVWTAAGWLYLAIVIDLYTRCIVGWAMADRMTTQLVKKAFQMAWRQSRPADGLLFHSDRGSQYTSDAFQRLLQAHRVCVSMSGTGNCYDNAVAESFFSTLKSELIYQTSYLTREEAITDIFFYIEGFYNRQRRHSALGYLSPLAYEAKYEQEAMAM
jgi:putative transposase